MQQHNKLNTEEFEELVQEILEDSDYLNNPYFTSLNKGTFDKNDFIETQKQFYFAVTFFSRPMAVLSAKIPTPQLRLEIVRNLWEEHGEGDFNKIHQTTFAELLTRLGNVNLLEIENAQLSPAVRVFNTTLIGACTLDDYKVGVAMMGMIERMFTAISSLIGKSIVKNKWLTQEELIHYDLHEVLDVKHSQDFFDILENTWSEDNHKYLIKQGLQMGAYIFNGLYRDLYENRHKRY